MTKRERVINSLLHKESDIVPYNVTFTQQMAEKMAEYLNDADFQNKLNNHICMSTLWSYTRVGKNLYADDAGVLWDTPEGADIGVVCNQLVPSLQDRTYRLPGLDREYLRSCLSWLKENKEDKFCVFDLGFALYERFWTLRGAENALMDMIENPSGMNELLDEIEQYLHDALDMALEYDFVDGILFSDDWGCQRGLLMGRKRWLEFFKNRYKSLYGKVKSSGKFTMHHSCGYIEDIFSDLIEIGLDCYQTFQSEVYNIEKVKKEYGKDLTFWGGISTQYLLPFASPEVVAAETARTLKIMGENGGYIAAPTHDITGDVPVENVLAMWKVFENQ